MTVFVDTLTIYPNAWGPFRGGSCHLAADSLDELHAFAARLGLKRAWFQDGRHPHYDLTASKRRRAVELGAKECDGRDLVALWHRQRAARHTEQLSLREVAQ